MAKRTNPQNVIESYKRRQQMTPYVIGGLAALLVIVGVVILVFALRLGGLAAPAPTDTPTVAPATITSIPPTATPVPPTATQAVSATATITATATLTNTPTGPFEYTVLEKDNCWDISIKFKVDLNTLLAINSFPAGQCPISPGQKIMIPAPGQTLPTATPVDVTKLPSGTLLEYVVQPGDTLNAIALRYYSTRDRIMAQNKITEANTLVAGQKLVIPVNIATLVPTTTDTPTPKPGTPSVTVGATTSAPSATVTVTPTKAP